MPARSKIDALPTAVRKWLDDALVEGSFAKYEQLEQLLGERGFSIGKSTIARYGQKLQKRLDAIQASTQAALLISEHSGDDGDSLGRAVTSLLQTQLFEVMVGLQEVESEEDLEARATLLAKVAKGAADLGKVSVIQKKWAIDIRERVERAANSAEKKARKAGMSADVAAAIRRDIMGITTS